MQLTGYDGFISVHPKTQLNWSTSTFHRQSIN